MRLAAQRERGLRAALFFFLYGMRYLVGEQTVWRVALATHQVDAQAGAATLASLLPILSRYRRQS